MTFLIGLACVPLIERTKERTKRRALYENIVEELNDETRELGVDICKMSSCLLTLESLLKGDTKEVRESKGLMKYVPRNIAVMFIDDVVKNNYKYLKKHQRKTLKLMPMQISGIEDILEKMSKIEMSQEYREEHIWLCKNFIYTACYLRAIMIEFVSGECLENSDKAIINSQLRNLDVEGLTYDSLIKRRTVMVNHRF